MITKETLERISNCTNITNSITIKYPITMAVSDSRDMVMRIDLSDMEEFDRPVSFFNRLSNFLCITKLYDDFKINVHDNIITIQDANSKSSTDFIESYAELMTDYNFDEEQFTKTENAVSIIEFELTANEVKKLKTAGGTLQNIEKLIIENQGEELKIKLKSSNIAARVDDCFTIVKDIPSNKQFNISIPFSNFTKLSNQNYKFFVKYNTKNNSYRVLIHNLDNDKIKLLLSVNFY